MGATTNLFPSMTLGSGSAGQGMTSDNVSPMNLLYIRKVGYGVRMVDEIVKTVNYKEDSIPAVLNGKLNGNEIDNYKLLESILKKVLQDLK